MLICAGEQVPLRVRIRGYVTEHRTIQQGQPSQEVPSPKLTEGFTFWKLWRRRHLDLNPQVVETVVTECSPSMLGSSAHSLKASYPCTRNWSIHVWGNGTLFSAHSSNHQTFFFFFLCPLDQSLAAWAAEQLTREEVTGIHLQKCCGRFRASHSFLPYPAWYLDLSIHIYWIEFFSSAFVISPLLASLATHQYLSLLTSCEATYHLVFICLVLRQGL